MVFRKCVARAGIFSLGAGALVGAGSLAWGGTAIAAACGATTVKGLTVSRSARGAASTVTQPTHALAFTGAGGAVAALLLGAALLLIGLALVAVGRRSRGTLWVLLLVGGIAAITMIGQHSALAATTATCPTTATTGTTAPVTTTPVTTTPVTTAPVTATAGTGTSGTGTSGTGTSGTGGTTPGGDPGTTTGAPPAALPDSSTPVELVLVAAAAGAVAVAVRRRRTA